MDESRLQLVCEIGTQLSQLTRFHKDVFLKSLKQAASALSEVERPLSSEASEDQFIKKLDAATIPLRKSIISHCLLQKNDKDVRLFVAICVTEIFRILAPEQPFEATYRRGIVKLIISIFKELGSTACPFFPKRVKILETVARCKCLVPILDIDDDLVLEMLENFFLVVSEHHQFSSVGYMLSIMTHILDEVASQPILEVILRNIVDRGKDASPAASQLAISIIQSRAEMLEPFVSGFLTSCIMNRDAVGSELGEYYHEIIFKLFQCAPRMLLAVMPKLTQELLTDQVDVRIKAVNLIGRLFALPKSCLAERYHDIFLEFLRRFSDKSAEVRLSALRCAKACYLASSSGASSHQILTALRSRLLDYDDRLRTEAMIVVCDIARSNLENIPPKLISEATERLRDKKISVRKKALQKLLEVYRDYCKRCSEGHMTICDHFEEIPCKVLMLCYEKDCKEFRSQNIERVLVEDLFPDLEIEQRARHWVHMFSLFTAFHMKAVDSILSQKRRLRAEMQLYLSIRKKEKGICFEETQKKMKSLFMKMAVFFPDPTKAEESFQKMNNMKDKNIFYALEELLDKPTTKDAQIVRDNFLKLIGNKHPDFEFLQLLSSKCVYIFDSDLVHCILDHLSCNVLRDKRLKASSVKLLLAIASFFPTMLRGSEVQLKKLFEGNDLIEEKLFEVLAKAGPHISVKYSDFSHFLEKVCHEGTRAQAKHAVSAIASLLSTSEQSVLSKLCKELLVSLRSGRNIPTALQSLGCIAQLSASTFETQDEDIRQYIYKNMVGSLYNENSSDETSGYASPDKLKIYGLKTLVKSFLPHKGYNSREEINDLLHVLSKMLNEADTFDAHRSCERDHSHIRLAAGKAVLRLSRRWDLHITPEIFRATILLAKDSSSFVRRSFIDKTQKWLKAHLIPSRYACALALAASDCLKDLQDDSSRHMADFIKEYSKEAQTRQNSAVQGASLTDYPAYIVVFLIHVLAHDPGFPPEDCQDKEIIFQFFRPLFTLVQSLINATIVEGDRDLIDNVTVFLLCIFHAIKRAEDAVVAQKTPNLHVLASIGISLINELDCTSISSSRAPGQIFLPSSLYKISLPKKSKEANSKDPSPCNFEKKFAERVVHILKAYVTLPSGNLHKSSKKHQEDSMQSDIIKRSTLHLVACKQLELPTSEMVEYKKENVRPETSLEFKRKRTVSPEAHATERLQNKRFVVEECQNDAFKCSEDLLEKELFSSCDSAPVEQPRSDTRALASNIRKGAASMKENVRPTTIITAEPSKHPRAKFKNPCFGLTLHDKRDDELFCLDSESDGLEMIGDGSLSEREVLLEEDSNTIHLRRGKLRLTCSSNRASHISVTGVKRTFSTCGEDIVQLPEANLKQERGNVRSSAVPFAAKGKRSVKFPLKPSALEAINISDDAVARRTRSRKA